MTLYLQTIADSIQYENLPQTWQRIDINDINYVKFSDKKTLYEYQQQALKNALKVLYKYYVDCRGDKKELFKIYENNGFNENLDYNLNGNGVLKIFEEFSNDYLIKDNSIQFYHFINRMCFWMATGSGKTLVIVKLIELLNNLIQDGQIPNNDILFLTYREDLIEQFKRHVNEFNQSNSKINININSLKEYEQVKRKSSKFNNRFDVFYYRSDLISDEHKDKIINFRNYDNNGKWYIILDEAHKGDKESSKRQFYYSILSRNGFLFNFSATFTDKIDFVTCAYDFNLEKFINNGFGKRIYLSRKDIETLNKSGDFTEEQKKNTILKMLLLYSYVRKKKLNIDNFYHNPLMLVLVNSVDTKDSDLELFFREIEKIAKGENIDTNDFDKAKDELIQELNGNYQFSKEKLNINEEEIRSLTIKDILLYVFNAQDHGKIEVLTIPNNKHELIFKLQSTEKPFGLIKIGDTSEWIKNKLREHQITERFEDESFFKNINEESSDITLLMGSRAFYEGWDSNRPNILLYINIGNRSDAKKFILQSIGRGVRIEPVPHKRKRLQYLYNNKEIDEHKYQQLNSVANILETLFVFGTKAKNLEDIVNTLEQCHVEEEHIGDLFEKNSELEDKLLLIPTYSESDKTLADSNFGLKFEINPSDFELMNKYINYVSDKIMLVKYETEPKIIQKIKSSFLNKDEIVEKSDVTVINMPNVIMKHLIRFYSIKNKKFDNFKKLENEIIHFEQIKITSKTQEKIKEKISKLKENIEKEIKTVKENVEDLKELKREKKLNLSKSLKREVKDDSNTVVVTFKYLPNHYYIPIAMSENEKEVFLKHIIKTDSEKSFIKELEEYISSSDDNFFSQLEWWFFSKIDETLDEIYIPYYQPKTNKIGKFKPDFIFWLKKGNNYVILFVDPKGTEHVEGIRKIDGYSRIFEEEVNNQKQCKRFVYGNLNIYVKLLYVPVGGKISHVTDAYKEYYFEKFDTLKQKLLPLLNI